MANFSAPVLYSPVTTSLKTAGFLYIGGTRTPAFRSQIYEMEMGQGNAAYASTDAPMQWDLSRAATASIVGTPIAANLLDTADYVAGSLFIQNVSTEPTYTTAGNGLNLKQWGINQRGSYRWRALDDGDNIIIPATVGVGAGLRAASITSGYAGSATGTISFLER
jgi:hypothetical protein